MNVAEEPQSAKNDGGLLGELRHETLEENIASIHGGGAGDGRGRLWR